MHVDDAVVISLPERTDRLMRLSASLPHPWPFPKLRMVEGVSEPPAPWYRSSPGAWGCARAHVNVLRHAWDNGVEATLVLEDDAVFDPAFTAKWADLAARVPADWSMLMLGGQHMKTPAYAGGPWVRCTHTRRTHAYLIRLKAIPLLMRTWESATSHIDHALDQVQAQARVYAPSQFIVGQAPGRSDISGQEHLHTRFWQ